MTYNSFGNEYYNGEVKSYLENVRLIGILIVDEVDSLMEETITGLHETFGRLFCGSERWNIFGLSATSDKLTLLQGDLIKTRMKTYELVEKDALRDNVKFIDLVSPTGKMIGFLGPNRTKELVTKLRICFLIRKVIF